MRTTLALDDDILEGARALAEQRRVSLGEIISELARQSLQRPAPGHERNGVALLPVSSAGAQVTLAVVNSLRDEAP